MQNYSANDIKKHTELKYSTLTVKPTSKQKLRITLASFNKGILTV